MDRGDLLSFIIGAAIGGAATYYAIKHQDEILAKIEELEANFKFSRAELIEKAKLQFEKLSAAFQATVDKYAGMIRSGETTTEEQKAQIVQELDRIRSEVQALAAEKE